MAPTVGPNDGSTTPDVAQARKGPRSRTRIPTTKISSKVAAGPKTARGEATRRAILDAAEEVIGRQGFNDASITEITRSASVASGTFYLYFRSKEEVFEELVLDMGRSLRRALSTTAEGAKTRLDAEKAGLRAFLAFVIAHPSLYRIVREALFVAPTAYRAYFQSFAEGYRSALADACAKGEIRPGDDDVRAWMLMGIAVTLGERYVVFGLDRPVDEVVEAAHDMIMSGLAP
jgi:AcrR family transcriptional regulator